MLSVKRLAAILAVVVMFVSLVSAVEIEKTGTKVGGAFKLYAADAMYGTWTDTNGVELTGKQNAGFSAPREYLIISQDIGEYVSVEAMPMFSASAGATPRLGRKIDTLTPYASISPTDPQPARIIKFNGWQKFYAKFMLPKGYEVSLGLVEPRLSYEYGTEIWWDEEFHVNKAAHDLGVSEDAGIEIYKNCEMGKLTMPVYFYILNGANRTIGDDNTTPMLLLHVEPQVGPVTFLGSFSWTKYDAKDSLNEMKWVVGANYSYKSFSVRGELMGLNSEGKNKRTNYTNSSTGAIIKATPASSSYDDATGIGFYVKPIYQYASWGKVGVDFSYAILNTNAAYEDKDLTITPLLIFTPVEGVNIISQNDIGMWNRTYNPQKDINGSAVVGATSKEDKIFFVRSTLGLRITF